MELKEKYKLTLNFPSSFNISSQMNSVSPETTQYQQAPLSNSIALGSLFEETSLIDNRIGETTSIPIIAHTPLSSSSSRNNMSISSPRATPSNVVTSSSVVSSNMTPSRTTPSNINASNNSGSRNEITPISSSNLTPEKYIKKGKNNKKTSKKKN